MCGALTVAVRRGAAVVVKASASKKKREKNAVSRIKYIECEYP